MEANELNAYKLTLKKNYQLIRCCRKLQLTNKVANVIYKSFIATSHHAGLMLLSFWKLFAIIRLRAELNYFSFSGICLASFLSLLIPFVEFKAVSLVRVNAALFLEVLKRRNRRNSVVGKTVRSLKIIEMDIGKPFYTVKRQTIIIYMQKLIASLVDALQTLKV